MRNTPIKGMCEIYFFYLWRVQENQHVHQITFCIMAGCFLGAAFQPKSVLRSMRDNTVILYVQ